MGSTLLVVEDSPVIGVLVKKIVERNQGDATLLTATNGKQGIDLLKARRPDVVVLDWMMPDFGGQYFLEEQKKDPEVAGIPVLIHTALSEDRIRKEIEAFPAVKEFLQKPVVPSKLLERVKAYLSGR
jgi:CheY-like chemotaxis protein